MKKNEPELSGTEILKMLRDKNIEVTLISDDTINLYPYDDLSRDQIEFLRKNKPKLIHELKREKRFDRVWEMLKEQPESKRAVLTDLSTNRDNAILTIAIRDQYILEMLIPKVKYDGFTVLEIIQKSGLQ